MRALLLIGLSFLVSNVMAADWQSDVTALQDRWAEVKYQLPEAQREDAFKMLSEQAEQVTAAYPTQAEPMVWEAIILATYAGEKGGLGALGLVKKSRDLLLAAEKIDPNALNGSIYTSLGSLFYQVPSWPIGFGDDDKAREYLQKALSINPNGIDPNYFYGDFLLKETEDYAEAVQVLEKALNAPARPDRAMADAGRRAEIQVALAEAKAKLNH